MRKENIAELIVFGIPAFLVFGIIMYAFVRCAQGALLEGRVSGHRTDSDRGPHRDLAVRLVNV